MLVQPVSRFVNTDDKGIWELGRYKTGAFTNATKRIKNKGALMVDHPFCCVFKGAQTVIGKRPSKPSAEMSLDNSVKIFMNALLVADYGA